METEYKITIGTDEREIPGTVISYEHKKPGLISDRATSRKDFRIVEVCKGLSKLLDSKEIEIIIKSK